MNGIKILGFGLLSLKDMINRLTHGLKDSGADIEYDIVREHQYSYTLRFFDDVFYLPKWCFYDNNIISYEGMFKLRRALKEMICSQPVIRIKRH